MVSRARPGARRFNLGLEFLKINHLVKRNRPIACKY